MATVYDAFCITGDIAPTSLSKKCPTKDPIIAVFHAGGDLDIRLSGKSLIVNDKAFSYAFMQEHNFADQPITLVEYQIPDREWNTMLRIFLQSQSSSIGDDLANQLTTDLPFKNVAAAKDFIAREVVFSSDKGIISPAMCMLYQFGPQFEKWLFKIKTGSTKGASGALE